LKIQTYLDTTLVTNPEGVRGLTQEITYNDEYKGIFFFMQSDLVFRDDAYDYIFNALRVNGACAQIDFLLQIGNDNLTDYFEGVIDVADVTEFNVTTEKCTTPIADNNASSYVTKNAKIKTYINVLTSKNGTAITAATKVVGVDFFTPSTGNYDYLLPFGYPVGDAFRYLVEFMSDGLMTASSPYFDAGGAKQNVMIFNGKSISGTLSSAAPRISFFELFQEMDKLYNISYYIDYSGSIPTMVIDKTDNLYSATNLYSFTDVKDVKVSFEKEKFYSKLKIGSSTIQEYSGGTFTFPDAIFLGFTEEEYFTLGQCNIDNELDLVSKFIIDSNIIEDMLLNANDSYDEETIIVETTGTQAYKYPNYLPSSFVYNLGLNNFSKAQNWLGSFPNDILNYLNNNDNGFDATKNSWVIVTGNLIHATAIFNPAGNYNGATGRFTAPLLGSGNYNFVFDYSGLSYGGDAAGVTTGTIQFVHYNAAGVVQSTIVLKTWVTEVIDITNAYGSLSGSFYLAATDYVRIEGTYIAGVTAFGFTHFRGDFADEGGTYQAYDPNDYKVFKISFEHYLSQVQFLQILSNPTHSITVSTGTQLTRASYKGWIKSISRNIITGVTKFVLRSSLNTRA